MTSKKEILQRIENFYKHMNEKHSDWDIAIIASEMNQYYYAGTIQNGLLILLKNGDVHYFAKKSYTRATLESPIENIHHMDSYRDIPAVIGSGFTNGYLELGKVPMKMYSMFNKHLQIQNPLGLDADVSYLRSIKSDYELDILREAGELQNKLLVDIVPSIVKEGMSEFEFVTEFNYQMNKIGHYGTTRFDMLNPPLSTGQISIGNNSTYPTNFDGPGGLKGLHPSTPYYGDRKNVLKKGDLVFVDIGFCVKGYNTDKTQVYSFGCNASDEAVKAHKECIRLQDMTVDMMSAGEIPSKIYNEVIKTLDKQYEDRFMGSYEQVKFLGHGIGLYVNEYPVIANGFDAPLESGMVLAIEPKIAILGEGTVGVEDSYIVTDGKCECITGGSREIIRI